jgi:hypothetical protein
MTMSFLTIYLVILTSSTNLYYDNLTMYELRAYHIEPYGSKGSFFQFFGGSVIIVINLLSLHAIG